jgi:hypothetical protein
MEHKVGDNERVKIGMRKNKWNAQEYAHEYI